MIYISQLKQSEMCLPNSFSLKFFKTLEQPGQTRCCDEKLRGGGEGGEGGGSRPVSINLLEPLAFDPLPRSSTRPAECDETTISERPFLLLSAASNSLIYSI